MEEEQRILPYYQSLKFNIGNSLYYCNEHTKENKITKGVSISLFPSYLSPCFADNKNLNIIKLPQKNIHGFAIILKKNIQIKDFMKLNYKKKVVHNINRYLNRFESCITPTYKFYFGKIAYDNYTYLMSKCRVSQRY